MSVGFGFSLGDLVTSLKLIKDSIEAVKDTKGAATDYAQLLTEINCLRDGFEAIEDLDLDHKGSHKQQTAINGAIGACQKCIDDFLTSISKYQPHLHSNASGLTSNYRKIKWALCRKDDVATFRSQLERHTSSINMLLITFQTKERMTSSGGGGSTAMVVKARDADREDHVATLLGSLSIEQRQCFEFLMHQNKELMRNLQEVHQMLRTQMSIHPQILLQRPVVLLDAFGKIAPFHLDFIDSLEAFIAVLKIRFKQAGVKQAGLAKLENREFSIQETRRKRFKDLSRPWSTIFQPGQEVDMSMVFHRFACRPGACPGCSSSNDGGEEQTQCPECGLCYQNIRAIKKSFDLGDQSSFNRSSPIDRTDFQYVIQHPGMKPETKIFSSTTEIDEDSFDSYRRVQVISQPITLFQTNQFPPQRLESFRHFVHLFSDSKRDILPHITEMKQMQTRINEHLSRTNNMPAFSSFSRIKRWQKQLAEEFTLLSEDIDRLFNAIRDDVESSRLIEYLEKHPSRPRIDWGYYADLLTNSIKANKILSTNFESDEATNVSRKAHSSPRARSKDYVQWMLLDSRGK